MPPWRFVLVDDAYGQPPLQPQPEPAPPPQPPDSPRCAAAPSTPGVTAKSITTCSGLRST
jgi:hypothetical protein